MRHTYKLINICILFHFGIQLQAQYYMRIATDTTILESDSVVLCVDNARGGINWQVTTDSINWELIQQQQDSLYIRIDSSASYRAMITEGTCNPVYSDTILLIEKITYTESNFFTVDSLGGVFLLPSGIKVKIPHGAVNDSKIIQVDNLMLHDAVNLGELPGADSITYISGISVGTEQFEFKKPIKIKIPVQGIKSADLPILFELCKEYNSWWVSQETFIVST